MESESERYGDRERKKRVVPAPLANAFAMIRLYVRNGREDQA